MAAQPPERISGLNVARYLTDSLRGSVLTLRARHEVPSCTGGWDGGGWGGMGGGGMGRNIKSVL